MNSTEKELVRIWAARFIPLNHLPDTMICQEVFSEIAKYHPIDELIETFNLMKREGYDIISFVYAVAVLQNKKSKEFVKWLKSSGNMIEKDDLGTPCLAEWIHE